MQLLDYRLPPFKTTAWVSDSAAKTWHPRFSAVSRAVVETVLEGCARGNRPYRCLRVQGALYYKLRASAGARDLRITTVRSPVGIGPAMYEVTVGRREAPNDPAACLPNCCRPRFRQAVASGRKELFWEAAQACENGNRGTPLVLAPPVVSAVFWAPMLATVDTIYLCRLDCPRRLEDQAELWAAMDACGFAEEAQWLREIYAWPLEWSALHGICELRTPVVKCAYDSDATAEQLCIRLEGTAYPEEGAPGKSFPYRQRNFLRISDSKSFREGLKHGGT